MNVHDLNILIDHGEGFRIEFKRRISSAEKIARTMISFANTKGGIILFGVDDDGSIVGVESEKSEMELIEMAGRDYADPAIVPGITIVPFDGRDVIVAQIDQSRTKPHYFLGAHDHINGEATRVYIRVYDKTVMASREVVKILQNENPDAPPLRIAIGGNERRRFQYLEQHGRVTVAEFGGLVNISDPRGTTAPLRPVRVG